jgi:ADP-heptose:LPS heptosyltransferase
MNVKLLHRADRWLGVPLCFLLTVVKAVFRRRLPEGASRPGNLLFIKLAEQGSTVLAYPALRRAGEMVGRENVYFMAFEDNRFILDALEIIPRENVITVSVQNVGRFLWSVLLAVQRLRRLKVEAAIDLEFFSRGSAALAYLSGARRRVGFHAFFGGGPYRGDLMTHRLLYNPHLHTSQIFLTLVEAAVCDPAKLPAFGTPLARDLPGPPAFVSSTEEAAGIWRTLGCKAKEHSPVILLNPNSSDLLPLRRWPAPRYAELARRLLARYSQMLVGFTGVSEEAAATLELARTVGSDRCISIAGKTTLRQLLVLYTLADVLVTNDSGPAHFATLTPIQVVTLFGPETPELFAADTPRNTVLWARLPCSPCVNAYNNRQSPCRDNLCMQAISVEEVFGAVCQAVDRRPVCP